MAKLGDKTCVTCGKTFQQRGWKQKYCGDCQPVHIRRAVEWSRAKRAEKKAQRLVVTDATTNTEPTTLQ